MKKQDLLLFAAAILFCTTSMRRSGDVTKSFYFGRAAFGDGSTSIDAFRSDVPTHHRIGSSE